MSDHAPQQQRDLSNTHTPELIPLDIEQLDILLRLIVAAKERLKSFACLGADLKLLTGAIMEDHPRARGLLADFSPDSVALVRLQIPGHEENLAYSRLKQSGADCLSAMARYAPLDAVVVGSQLSISSSEREKLFTNIFPLLNPGGVLLCVGDIPSATRHVGSPMDDYLIEAVFGNELRQHPNLSRKEIAREYFKRIEGDEKAIAPLEVQCDWLTAAGFIFVGCFSKVAQLTVFGGQRPENPSSRTE